MSSEEGAPGRIVGGRAAMSRRQVRFLVVALVVYAAFLAWTISRGHWSSTVTAGFFVVVATVRAVRKPTVVSPDGISRPWRRPGSVSWSEVDRIARPQPGIPGVQLWMKSGSTVTLDDVAADQTEAASRIAGIPIGYSTHPRVSPRSPSVRDDTAADVDRRAQALADRGKLLDAEYRRIRGERPPGTS